MTPPEEERLTLTREAGDRGPSLAERLAERLRRAQYASPLHKRRLAGCFPLKLLAVPDDPVPGDPAAGEALRAGRLAQAGHAPAFADARFDAGPAAWRDWANGWGWLRDYAAACPAAERPKAVKRTEALAARWIAAHPAYHRDAWRADIAGRRLLMWCLYAPYLIASHDHVQRSAVLNAMARWSRHVHRAAPRLPHGLPRLEATVGFHAAALLLPAGESQAAEAERMLTDAVQGVLHPDGSPRSRCPLDLLAVADLLLCARACAAAVGRPAGEAVALPLARAVVTLAALCHGDGRPAPWHGGAPDAAAIKRLLGQSPVLALSPPGPESGYQRVAAGDAVLVMDAGPPPAARLARRPHASTLAFTLSHGSRPLLVNCGGDAPGRPLPDDLAEALRSTAAHCALVLDDTNSTRLPDGSARHAHGVEQVRVSRRRQGDGWHIDARHDGYRRRFGFDHQRRLFLAADGAELRGEDALLPEGRPHPLRAGPRRAPAAAVRFHLAPAADPTLTEDGLGALIRLGDAAWAFRAAFKEAAAGGTLGIEPSVHVDADGRPQPTRQLTLRFAAPTSRASAVGWSFRRVR